MIDASPPPLPPVADRWLRVFVEVVYSGSFTAAANRLGVGQSSVSHAIKRLETALGTQLFDRVDGGARPTDGAVQLHARVAPAFETVDGAVLAARRSRREDALVALSVSTSFATWWLLPRLATFKAEHPDIELRCITSDSDDRIGLDDADLWIPHGPSRWERLEAKVLVDERIVAVAAPSVAASLAEPDVPTGLLGAELIHLEERYVPRFDWSQWFARHGLPAPPTRGARSNDYAVVVQAALDGQGVALGWDHIVGPLIDDGRLVVVGGDPIVTDEPFVVLQRRGPQRPAVDALSSWLRASVRPPPSS